MRIAIGVLIAVIVGVLIGRASAPGTSPTPLEAAPSSPGPTGESAGVGVGFSRSREGAALAAGSYQQAFADTAILRPGELRRRIEVVATPGFAPRMLAANEHGTAQLAGGAFGEGIRAQVQSAFFGVPVSYRLLSYTPSRAIVQTWGFTLLGNVGSVEPTAFFGLARTVLAWTGGDWKIANTRASFGPTPRLGTPRPGGEGIGLIELVKELHRYAVAP
ncbi:MAG TPA: hypothetical protein VN758_05075 [Solirubrobacterales bacterium]|nr:hypothetical protein [Solirubrobacterales bacterium]